MKPVENYEAECAYKANQPVFILDKTTGELIHLNKCTNKNSVLNVFTQPYYVYDIYK